jgi:hypothetical protein
MIYYFNGIFSLSATTSKKIAFQPIAIKNTKQYFISFNNFKKVKKHCKSDIKQL